MPRDGTARTSKPDILETFGRMVADRGYDGVTFRLIADELGLSKGTIVHHYGSKDRLLEALHRGYLTRRLEEAHEILARITDPAEQLAALIAQLLLAQRDDRPASVAVQREITRFASLDLMNDVRAMRGQYTQLMRGVLERGMKDGVFRPNDSHLVALQIFGMCSWAWTWLRPHGRWTVAEIVRTWTETVLDGLTLPPGHVRDSSSVRIIEIVEETMAWSADGRHAPVH